MKSLKSLFVGIVMAFSMFAANDALACGGSHGCGGGCGPRVVRARYVARGCGGVVRARYVSRGYGRVVRARFVVRGGGCGYGRCF